MLSGFISIFANSPLEENSETPKHPVGTRAVTPDGRTFRYAKAGATALVIANLQVQADLTAHHEDIAFAAAGSIGDDSISVTLGATAVTANEYDGGYVTVIDDTGEGYNYEIVSHGVSSGSEAITVYIKPGLKAATTTSTTVTLVRNPYSAVVIATGGSQADLPAGVTVRAVTAKYFCWLQTGGIASVLSSGTNVPTAGQPITIGEADNGSVSERDAIAEPLVGIALTGVNATADEHNPYFLTLDK